MSNADPGRTRPVFQWLAQLFALMGKESKQIIRDPSSYLVAAILPMIFLLLFGYGITLDAGVMDIVILDESNHLLICPAINGTIQLNIVLLCKILD